MRRDAGTALLAWGHGRPTQITLDLTPKAPATNEDVVAMLRQIANGLPPAGVSVAEGADDSSGTA